MRVAGRDEVHVTDFGWVGGLLGLYCAVELGSVEGADELPIGESAMMLGAASIIDGSQTTTRFRPAAFAARSALSTRSMVCAAVEW
jgi:hypothetical protein